MSETPPPSRKWEQHRRTYEERYQRFCEEWHLDPEDPQSAVEFELFNLGEEP